jgi:hypothetical protein
MAQIEARLASLFEAARRSATRRELNRSGPETDLPAESLGAAGAPGATAVDVDVLSLNQAFVGSAPPFGEPAAGGSHAYQA